jgi:hypothetical protein
MTKIINTTPHNITFLCADGGVMEVPPCGTLISARAVEEVVGSHPTGAVIVTTRFEPTEAALADLSRLEAENPGAVIVGSIIAAQAFPGRVFGMTPALGFERVPPAEKRMDPNKFTTF